jgi:FkbM family methyltransferase
VTISFGTFVTVNDARLYLDPTDGRADALRQRDGRLHPDAMTLWRHALEVAAWDWIVDVGANYGEMLVGSVLPAGARVAAVEPNPRVVPYLARSLRDAVPAARVLACAVSDATGSVPLYEDLTWSGNSTLADEWIADRADHQWRSIDVPALTLDDLLAEIGIGVCQTVLLKLDIEGYEVRVLRTAIARLRAAPRCAAMVEIVRLSRTDLDWLLAEFKVSLLDTRHGVLVAAPRTADALTAVIARGDVYCRDVIAEPRRPLGRWRQAQPRA